MTEAEWLAESDLDRLLGFAGEFGSARKLRLCLAACLRAAEARAPSKPVSRAASAAERYADGRATADDLAAEQARASAALDPWERIGPETLTGGDEDWAFFQTQWLHRAAYWALAHEGESGGLREVLNECGYRLDFPGVPQAEAVRDILGNPFRPVAFDPRWRTADAIGLARGIYEDEVFDRLPLLADALMDAGCGDWQILDHCRSAGPHVRGCWLIDLVLDQG